MDLESFTYDSLKNYIEKNDFIYIIYSEYGCKIGYSKSPLDRIEQIKTGLPSQNCTFIGLFLGDKSIVFEKKLHKIFYNQKISGEWFILTDENLDYIHNYLVKNDFKCFIKKSIIWANYLMPSIYIKGKVKVIKGVNHENNNSLLIIPRVFYKLFIKPEIDEINCNEVEFLTPKVISERLKMIGLKYHPIIIGKYLKSMNFERKTKRIDNIGVRKGYYLIMLNKIPN